VNDLASDDEARRTGERAVRNSSKAGIRLLDVFGGSGNDVIACEKVGRHARLIELETEDCDVIIRRWQEFTGQEATLDSDGKATTGSPESEAQWRREVDRMPRRDWQARRRRFSPATQT